MEGQRVIGGNGGGAISDKIDFDAGRESYSGRLSQYQEKERREASSRSRRFVLRVLRLYSAGMFRVLRVFIPVFRISVLVRCGEVVSSRIASGCL